MNQETINKLKSFLIEYLTNMVNLVKVGSEFKYNTREELIKKEGMFFETQKYPKELKFQRGEKKVCFRNSYILSVSAGLIYTEGFGISEKLPIPIFHAWCIDKEGKVVDPTWDDQEDILYMGIPMNPVYVDNKIKRVKLDYGIIDNPTERFPILRGKKGHLLEDFIHPEYNNIKIN